MADLPGEAVRGAGRGARVTLPTAAQLYRLPWAIQGPTRRTDEHDNRWWEIRIAELPEFFVAGETRDEVMNDYPDALTTFLEGYTERNELPPIPVDTLWRWLVMLSSPGTTEGAVTTGSGMPLFVVRR